MVDLPFGYETFYFGLVSVKDIGFLSDEMVTCLVFTPGVPSQISPSSRISSRVSVRVSPRIASTSRSSWIAVSS